MRVFDESKSFPREERYSLTDQVRRSSRGVATNIAEAFRKRRYRAAFVSKLSDADSEATETQVWADFAFECGYLDSARRDRYIEDYEEIGRMLSSMMADPSKFQPR